MPPLSKALRSQSPKGYAAIEELPSTPPVPKEPGRVLGANPFIRCPLPPFNATSDTLRQFDENGKIPTRRVIPLPAQIGAGGSTTIVQNTAVTSQSGGSSGSGNSPVVVAAKTVTINAPTLLPGDVTILTVTVTKVMVLMLVGASDLCEVRIYGDSTSQISDVSRATDTAAPFEVTQGLVTDVVLDTTPLQFNWQNRLFVNQDSPQTSKMYVTILNPSAGAVTPAVTITYLPLE
jgi:hypothetical protein